MENGLFAETAPPPQSIINIIDNGPNNQQISFFNDMIFSAFDTIQPRLDSIERSLKLAEKNKKGPLFDTSSKLNSSLVDLQSTMPNLHDNSIILSRRIQNLSSKAQNTATIAGPKRIRPVIDDFTSLKIEFDQSLKHITTLTENFNKKIEKLNEFNKKTSKQIKSLKKLQKDIEKTNSANQRNSQIIDELREKIINQAKTERSELINNFDQTLTEAENLVKELEDLAEQGLNDTNKTIVKLTSEKFDIQTSFESLSTEIENSMNNRVKELRSRVSKNIERSDLSRQKIDLELSSNLDKIMDDINDSPAFSFLDQIEQDQEAEELENLLNRIENLKKEVTELNPPKLETVFSKNLNKMANEKSNKEEKVENNVKTFIKIIDGTKRTISCHENGTFDIQIEPYYN